MANFGLKGQIRILQNYDSWVIIIEATGVIG